MNPGYFDRKSGSAAADPDSWLQLVVVDTALPVVSDALPRPRRFVAMTGFTPRGVANVRQWIRPAMTMTG